MSDELLTLGRWIEARRKAEGWTRPALAVRACVSENTVYRIEIGADTRLGTYLRILRVLDAHLAIHSEKA